METRPFGPGQARVAVIGQGTWRMGEDRARADDEVAALREGIRHGMTHIDTAESYASGGSEQIVAEVIRGQREKVFLASKVLPGNASYDGTLRACERSLKRLETDYLDLYMLHWHSHHPLTETMRALETLVDRGLVKLLGVSNFDVEDLAEAQAALRHHPLASNQVLYHLWDRTVENRVLPFCRQHKIAVVGYTPFGKGDFPGPGRQGQLLKDIAQKHGRTPRQVALNFLTREPELFAIPKAARLEHVRENAGGTGWQLDAEDIAALEEAFPRPPVDQPIDMF